MPFFDVDGMHQASSYISGALRKMNPGMSRALVGHPIVNIFPSCQIRAPRDYFYPFTTLVGPPPGLQH
jgi:hypothetical protein